MKNKLNSIPQIFHSCNIKYAIFFLLGIIIGLVILINNGYFCKDTFKCPTYKSQSDSDSYMDNRLTKYDVDSQLPGYNRYGVSLVHPVDYKLYKTAENEDKNKLTLTFLNGIGRVFESGEINPTELFSYEVVNNLRNESGKLQFNIYAGSYIGKPFEDVVDENRKHKGSYMSINYVAKKEIVGSSVVVTIVSSENESNIYEAFVKGKSGVIVQIENNLVNYDQYLFSQILEQLTFQKDAEEYWPRHDWTTHTFPNSQVKVKYDPNIQLLPLSNDSFNGIPVVEAFTTGDLGGYKIDIIVLPKTQMSTEKEWLTYTKESLNLYVPEDMLEPHYSTNNWSYWINGNHNKLSNVNENNIYQGGLNENYHFKLQKGYMVLVKLNAYGEFSTEDMWKDYYPIVNGIDLF